METELMHHYKVFLNISGDNILAKVVMKMIMQFSNMSNVLLSYENCLPLACCKIQKGSAVSEMSAIIFLSDRG